MDIGNPYGEGAEDASAPIMGSDKRAHGPSAIEKE